MNPPPDCRNCSRPPAHPWEAGRRSRFVRHRRFSRGRHAVHGASIGRSLQAMHQHDFAMWCAGGPFGFDEYLDLGIGVVKLLFDGAAPRAGWPGPEVRRDGLQVRVLEEGHERLQSVLSGFPCAPFGAIINDRMVSELQAVIEELGDRKSGMEGK